MTGPLLAIESSTGVGSVAIGVDGRLIAEVVREVGAGHSSALLPAADEVLRAARLVPRDLAGIVVGSGPGSFTGLRIAAATAKGMVRALGIPLFGYSGLLAAAASAWAAETPVCALFDARQGDVFAAVYTFPGGGGVKVRLAPTALPLRELIERFRREEAPLFIGDGALLHRQELERELGARVGPAELAQPRASALLWLVENLPEQGRIVDPAGWEPEYLRASGAERIAARLAEGGAA